MNTAVVNIKTDPKVKAQAQKVAEDLGFSLSALVNAYLRELIQKREVRFALPEIPNASTRKALKESERDRKLGYVSPAFSNVDEVMAWLENPKSKYINGKSVSES